MRGTGVDFKTVIDHVNIADIVYPGNRFQITVEIATTVWLGTAESYKYKPNRVHFRDIYKIDDALIAVFVAVSVD